MPTRPSPQAPNNPATHAVAYWQQQVQHLPTDETRAAQTLLHARQALLLAARQAAPAPALATLARTLHPVLMGRGWVRTWAQELQALLNQRPDVAEHTPRLWDDLVAAWIAAGDWSQARAALEKVRRGPDARARLGHWLYRQAALAWMQGRWAQALRLGQQAWRLLPPHHQRGQVPVAALLLLATWRLGRLRQARRWGQRALALCPADEALWRGRLHHYLMLVRWPTEPQAAQRHLRWAVEHLREAGAWLQLAHLWADSTDLYLHLGRAPQAEAALARAYALWRHIEDPSGLADYYRHAAIVAHACGRPDLARDYAAHAAERWSALHVPSEVKRCRALLRRWGPNPRRVLLPAGSG